MRLSLDDWRRIHAYAAAELPPWVARMLVLALVTGQRRGDLQAMRFDDAHDGHLHITRPNQEPALGRLSNVRAEGIRTSAA